MAGKSAKSSERSSVAGPGGYTVLARRYRSQDFDEIVGQEAIARTLKNAVETGRTAHAYLFFGTRGVGKTSMARIFAKALNATDDLAEAEEIGKAILRGEDLDVIEIDAASNRGVNEARDLIANAGLMPARCRYKIYIIDEVHALTKDAFNALLKTMEEPPGHVKFILCTTDPHKVPATIQSRCQRFDFRAIPTQKIADHLQEILKKENISADREVVLAVARHGNGSMRDALSLMDRLLAVGEAKLTVDLLDELLGLPEQSAVAGLVDAIATGEASSALKAANDLLSRGGTVDQALEALIEQLRLLLVTVTCGAESDLLDVAEETRASLAGQAKRFEGPTLVHMIALCDAVSRSTKGSSVARAVFEAAVVRLTLAEQFVDSASGDEGTPSGGAGAARQPSIAGGEKKKADDNGEGARRLAPAMTEQPAAEGGRRGAAVQAEVEPKVEITKELKDPDSSSRATMSAEEAWARVVEAAGKSVRFGPWIDDLEVKSYEGKVLKLAVGASGASRARYMKLELESFSSFVRQAVGEPMRVELDITKATAGAVKTNATAETLAAAKTVPIVAFAAELFGATVVDVQPAEGFTNPSEPSDRMKAEETAIAGEGPTGEREPVPNDEDMLGE